MSYVKDPRVDDYIDALPGWQRRICGEVRDLVHAADPEVIETIKRSRQPYFVLEGNICALLAAKDHVNVFLYDGGIVPDPERIITAGHDNKTARTVAVREGEALNTRRAAGDGQGDHRQQPRRRLAGAEAQRLTVRVAEAAPPGRPASPDAPVVAHRTSVRYHRRPGRGLSPRPL